MMLIAGNSCLSKYTGLKMLAEIFCLFGNNILSTRSIGKSHVLFYGIEEREKRR
jgi:hypothetical protein